MMIQRGGVPTRLAKSTRSSGATDVDTPFGCATVDYPGAVKSRRPIDYQAQEGDPEGKARDIRPKCKPSRYRIREPVLLFKDREDR